MTPFADVWAFTSGVPGYFSEIEARALYDAATSLPDGSTCVEVGVQFGRSASVLLQLARDKPLKVVFVDSWVAEGERARREFHSLVGSIPLHEKSESTIIGVHSIYASQAVSGWAWASTGEAFGLLHLDANHEPAEVFSDCRLWLPLLLTGGIACFHDYRRTEMDGTGDIWPGVTAAVDKYCEGWDVIGNFDTLAVRRKR